MSCKQPHGCGPLKLKEEIQNENQSQYLSNEHTPSIIN